MRKLILPCSPFSAARCPSAGRNVGQQRGKSQAPAAGADNDIYNRRFTKRCGPAILFADEYPVGETSSLGDVIPQPARGQRLDASPA